MDVVSGRKLLRPLGALEKYTWLIDVFGPKHFTVSAEIEGQTTLNEWIQAINKLQMRHPLICSGVDTNHNGELCFFYDDNAIIRVRTVNLRKVSSLENEIEREYASPFSEGDYSLMKVAFLHDEERCIVIVTTHHVIADGLSVASFIKDLVSIVAGKELPALPLLPSLEYAYKNIQENKLPGEMNIQSLKKPRDYAERNQKKLNVTRLKLSTGLTEKIIQKAKERQITIHCLVSAALALARDNLSGKAEDSVRICTPVNARKHTDLNYGLCFFALIPTHEYKINSASTIWSVADEISASLNEVKTKEGIASLIKCAKPFMESKNINDMIDYDKEQIAPDITISNLGIIEEPGGVGHLTLKAVWGPCVLIGTEGEHMVGVATINGSIHLIHITYEGSCNLLKMAEQILADNILVTSV
ncbi:TPA: condensation domain-containing protein [Escherichia coli]